MDNQNRPDDKLVEKMREAALMEAWLYQPDINIINSVFDKYGKSIALAAQSFYEDREQTEITALKSELERVKVLLVHEFYYGRDAMEDELNEQWQAYCKEHNL